MTTDSPVADPSATPWLEERYLDAIALYREISAAGSSGYPRRRLRQGERWTEALDLLLVANVVIEVPAPRSRSAHGGAAASVLKPAHPVGAQRLRSTIP